MIGQGQMAEKLIHLLREVEKGVSTAEFWHEQALFVDQSNTIPTLSARKICYPATQHQSN